MKNQKIIPVLFALALLFPLLASAESAKAGKFGIGGNTTLGGVNGLQIRTFVSPVFGLHGTFGLVFQTHELENSRAKGHNAAFRMGLGGDYVLAQAANTVISVGLEGDFLIEDGEFGEGITLILGLPLTGEYFLSQYFSIHAQTGLSMQFLGLKATRDIFGMDLSSNLLGNAGFTVWFN